MENKANLKKFFSVLFFCTYLILGLLTLKKYNISWDEPTHFKRGQAYLWFFLTGEKIYDKLPKYDQAQARINPHYHARSLYQEDGFDTIYYESNDGDHPVLNDILASLTNYIFYQKLGIMGDVESYHFFGIFTSAVLVALIFIFGYEAFGFWSGAFAALFMGTYPLFWGESHFNIKDPIETTFFTLSIYFLWKGVVKINFKYFWVAAIFVGIALATKLNILFLPFIILPWLIFIIISDKKRRDFILSGKFFLVFGAIPLIAYFIFVISWPWIWQDLFGNTLKVFSYYKEIGTESNFSLLSLFKGWSFYAIKWVIYATPLYHLPLFLGFIILFFKKRKNMTTLLLFLFWFMIPILRVSFPGTSIYGGVRQIMEYIPALSLISGSVAGFFIGKIKPLIFKSLVFIFFVLASLLPLVKLHPNENVYLNALIGGLSGAVKVGFPSAGFTFGNAYLQGLEWINKNAEEGAKLALVQGTILNIPVYKIRSDINYSNAHWSGIGRAGEYLTDLTYNYELRFYHYAWEYVEKMLKPVFEVKVGNVSVLKVWKNDLKNTNETYRRPEIIYKKAISTSIKNNHFVIALPETLLLTRLRINFKTDSGCEYRNIGYLETSVDGENWFRELDTPGEEQISGIKGVDANRFIFFFAGRNAKYIRIPVNSLKSCILNNSGIDLYLLK